MKNNIDVQKAQYLKTRREFLRTTTKGLGAAAIGSLLLPGLMGQSAAPVDATLTRPVDRIVAPELDIRYVNASRVNMRQGPGTNYSILSRLLSDDKVTVLEDSGTGWLRLKVDKTGRVGWIAASLLTKKAP